MDIKQLRYLSKADYSLSAFIINDSFFCTVLEDEKRDVKVKGETRIDAGEYFLGIRQEITPLTQKYLDDPRLPFFERHIEVLNVPKFVGVYIHIGNTDEDTDACLLVGQKPLSLHEDNKIIDSVKTYTAFYSIVYPKLVAGEIVKLIIKDVL
jgi:hypothetical protein